MVPVSCGQGADLDEVVGEDTVSAPSSCAVDASEVCAVPAVASFEMVDPSFGSGSPFDLVAESSPVLELAAGSAGFAHPRDGHGAYAELVQVAFDGGQTVAAVSGHGPWWAAGAASDPFDRWRQLRCVDRVSEFDGVVEDHSVGVIDDLRLIAELHRFAQPTLADWAGIDIMQADHPVC